MIRSGKLATLFPSGRVRGHNKSCLSQDLYIACCDIATINFRKNINLIFLATRTQRQVSALRNYRLSKMINPCSFIFRSFIFNTGQESKQRRWRGKNLQFIPRGEHRGFLEHAHLVMVGKPFLSPFEFQTLLCRVEASAQRLIQAQNDRAVSMDFSNLKLGQNSNLKILK